MIRAALAVASAAAIGRGAHIATAQQDPIAARKALMKGNADQAKIGADMTKGEAPFDLAKVKKIFATFEDTAAKAPALFPEHSIDQPTADDPYTASPKIWENMDDFKARLVAAMRKPPAQAWRTSNPSRRRSVTSARMIAAAATKNTVSSRADTF